jgi:hydrogenase maturation factor
MRSGKLPPGQLDQLIARLSPRDARVVIGPRLGEDAGVVALEGATLVVTTDPVTFVSGDAAWYAVHVNANDVAAMGADPLWLAVTVLLPVTADDAAVEAVFVDLDRACTELGIAVITGHTEATQAVTRPVIVGTMIGLTGSEGAISSGGAQPGDAVLLAGPIAVEGTAALATEAVGPLRLAGVSEQTLARAADFLRRPGISVVKAARVLRRSARPHALHDATEGGVATALREVAAASGAGMRILADRLPVLPETLEICRALALDPLGLIASGCLVAALDRAEVAAATETLETEGIAAAVVGEITSAPQIVLRRNRFDRAMPEFERDELARYFDGGRPTPVPD